MSKKCQNCGKQLINKQVRWCGERCREKGSYENKKKRKKLLETKFPSPIPKKVCVICEREFQPMNRRVLCCSQICSSKRKLLKLYEYNDRRRRSSSTIKIQAKCQDCGVDIRVHKSAAFKRCQRCKDRVRRERAKNKPNPSRIIIPDKLNIGIEEYKETRPKKLKSHDPEIQEQINAFLKKGGVVKVAAPQKEPDSLYQTLTEELSDYISNDLI